MTSYNGYNSNGQSDSLNVDSLSSSTELNCPLSASFSSIANVYHELGLRSTSRFLGRQVLMLEPESMKARLHVARICMSEKNYMQVLHVLKFSTKDQSYNTEVVDNDEDERADKLWTAEDDTDDTGEMRLLVGKSLLQMKRHEESVKVIGDISSWRRCKSALRAALCFVKARAYEEMDEMDRTFEWLKQALWMDITCYESFEKLVGGYIASEESVRSFIYEVTKRFLDIPDHDVDIEMADCDNTDMDTSAGETSSCPRSDLLNDVRREMRVMMKLRGMPRRNKSSFYVWLSMFYRAFVDLGALCPEQPLSMRFVPYMAYLRAQRAYNCFDYECALETLEPYVQYDVDIPRGAIEIYLASLVEVDDRQKLFIFSNSWIEHYPNSVMTWLACAYYYFANGKYDQTRKFLRKCLSIERRCFVAWMALGYAYSIEDESDQALMMYRMTRKLFPRVIGPVLEMGVEYTTQLQLSNGHIYLSGAACLDSRDIKTHHELGVLFYELGEFNNALTCFARALRLWEELSDKPVEKERLGRTNYLNTSLRKEGEEVTVINMGHCYRRLGQLTAAKHCYKEGLRMSPNEDSMTFLGLGMTLHLTGDIWEAIQIYNQTFPLCDSEDEKHLTNALRQRALTDLAMYGFGERNFVQYLVCC